VTAVPDTTRKRIFISVANREHQALRAALRDVLTRAGFAVVVQPDFPHAGSDTVRKLDGLIGRNYRVPQTRKSLFQDRRFLRFPRLLLQWRDGSTQADTAATLGHPSGCRVGVV
jgi:hypothetical protein